MLFLNILSLLIMFYLYLIIPFLIFILLYLFITYLSIITILLIHIHIYIIIPSYPLINLLFQPYQHRPHYFIFNQMYIFLYIFYQMYLYKYKPKYYKQKKITLGLLNSCFIGEIYFRIYKIAYIFIYL